MLWALSQAEPLEVASRKASLLSHRGSVHLRKGEPKHALECYQKSLNIRMELGIQKDISYSLNNIGTVYWHMGELDRALEYQNNSLKIKQDIGDKIGIARSINNIGEIYRQKGDLDLALQYAKRSLALREEVGNKQSIAASCNVIGDIFRQKGDLNQALEYLKRTLTIHEELGNDLDIAWCTNSIAKIHRQKGEFQQALQHFEKSLELEAKVGNPLYMSETLVHLVSLCIDMEALEKAKEYSHQLQEVAGDEVTEVIKLRSQLAKALILKTNLRARNRVQAEDILEYISREEHIGHEFVVTALINLCELQLTELRITGDSEVLQDIKDTVARLLKIAKAQHSNWLLAESYVLQSSLSLLELNLKPAQRFLDQAQFLAEEKGLKRLAMKISSDHDRLLRQMSSWEDMIEREATLNERANAAQLEELMGRLLSKRKAIDVTETPEEESVLLIILTESGVTVFSRTFPQVESFLDDGLIGGFLTAINAFLGQLFATSGSIERIMHKEYTILLRSKAPEPLLFCYVFKGQSYYALQKLDLFIEAVMGSSTTYNALVGRIQKGESITRDEEETIIALVDEIFSSSV